MSAISGDVPAWHHLAPLHHNAKSSEVFGSKHVPAHARGLLVKLARLGLRRPSSRYPLWLAAAFRWTFDTLVSLSTILAGDYACNLASLTASFDTRAVSSVGSRMGSTRLPALCLVVVLVFVMHLDVCTLSFAVGIWILVLVVLL